MPEVPVPAKSWVSPLTLFRLDVLNLALLWTEKALDSVRGIRLPRVSSVRTVLCNTDSSGIWVNRLAIKPAPAPFVQTRAPGSGLPFPTNYARRLV